MEQRNIKRTDLCRISYIFFPYLFPSWFNVHPHSSVSPFSESLEPALSCILAFYPFNSRYWPPTIAVFEVFFQHFSDRFAEMGVLYVSDVITFHNFLFSSSSSFVTSENLECPHISFPVLQSGEPCFYPSTTTCSCRWITRDPVHSINMAWCNQRFLAPLALFVPTHRRRPVPRAYRVLGPTGYLPISSIDV